MTGEFSEGGETSAAETGDFGGDDGVGAPGVDMSGFPMADDSADGAPTGGVRPTDGGDPVYVVKGDAGVAGEVFGLVVSDADNAMLGRAIDG